MKGAFEGRIAVISGATSGIGEAIARRVLDGGGLVVAGGRRLEHLDRLEREYNGDCKRIECVAGDVANPDTASALLNKAREAFGAVANLIVVNAGRGLAGTVLTSDVEQWPELLDTNVLGALYLLRAAGCQMSSASGEIARDLVVMGSSVGRHISPFSGVYGATKAAVGSLAEALRRELGPRGVRVTLIEPGIVESEFQAGAGYDKRWFQDFANRIGPVLQPPDIARLVEFIVTQPAHVHINDVLIRPTRQEYP